MKNLYGVVVISLYCATANAALNELSGAWAGSIGGSSIAVCFNESEELKGVYYSDEFKAPIRLIAIDDVFSAKDKKIETLSGTKRSVTHLLVRYENTLAKTEQVVSLKRVNNSALYDSCSSVAFAGKLATSRSMPTIEYQGHVYNYYKKNGVPLFSLTEKNAVTDKINKDIYELIHPLKTIKAFELELKPSLGSNGSIETSEASITPQFWSSDYLSLNFNQWSVDTGRSGVSWASHTWDLKTGDRVDPWAWVNTKYLWKTPYSGTVKLPKKLTNLLYAITDNLKNCPALDSYDTYEMVITRQGLLVSSPATGNDCDKEWNLTWAQLYPILTPEGKIAAAKMSGSNK